MEKLNIADYEFNNFGSNIYTYRMKLISSTDRPSEIVEKVIRLLLVLHLNFSDFSAQKNNMKKFIIVKKRRKSLRK